MVAAVFRTIFAQPDLASMTKTWDKVRDEPTARYPKIGPLMDAAKARSWPSPRSPASTGARSGPLIRWSSATSRYRLSGGTNLLHRRGRLPQDLVPLLQLANAPVRSGQLGRLTLLRDAGLEPAVDQIAGPPPVQA